MVCYGNGLIVPQIDKDKRYINAIVTNTGSTPTTVTNYVGDYYKTKLNYILNQFPLVKRFFKIKPDISFIIKCDAVHHVLLPGEQWTAQADQVKELEKMAQDGCLYMGIYHSMSQRPVFKRITIKK